MRLIIAGSRSIVAYPFLEAALERHGIKPDMVSLVLCGEARGADMLGREWASRNGISVKSYPADWTAYGKQAGMIRNEIMAQNADALLALWDGLSEGTRHMIARARAHGLKVWIHSPSHLAPRT